MQRSRCRAAIRAWLIELLQPCGRSMKKMVGGRGRETYGLIMHRLITYLAFIKKKKLVNSRCRSQNSAPPSAAVGAQSLVSGWFCSSITHTINGQDSNRPPDLDVLLVGGGEGLV